MLASASGAIVIGFNVRPTAAIRKKAKEEGVDIRLYNIIYKAVEQMESAMKGMLDPIFEEIIHGQAEVRQTFKASKVGTIAGCMVTDGKMVRNSFVRLMRDGVVVYDGKLSSLKRFQNDAKEVMQGFECGLTIANFNDIKVNDVLEAYGEIEVERE
jgi:translation initiation factor IF-2